MTADAYTDLLHGNGYHLLREVISAEEAAEVRNLALSKLDEAQINGQIADSQDPALGADYSKYGDEPSAEQLSPSFAGRRRHVGRTLTPPEILPPNCPLGGLHVDYPYWAMNPGVNGSGIDDAGDLDDGAFTEHNGGTWVAPGSRNGPERRSWSVLSQRHSSHERRCRCCRLALASHCHQSLGQAPGGHFDQLYPTRGKAFDPAWPLH